VAKIVLRPNEDISVSGFSQYPDEGDFYAKVNEDGDGDGDDTYVSRDSLAGSIRFGIPSSSVGGSINEIVVYIRIRSTDATIKGAGRPLVRIDDSSTWVSDTKHEPGISYELYSWTLTENPVTENPWTWSDIDALQIGATLYEGKYNSGGEIIYPVRMTQVWLEIDYTNKPTAILEATSGITNNAATVNGKISDDGGEACDVRFRWRKKV